MRKYTEQEQARMGKNIAKAFYLKRDSEHRDRWKTTWGSKTDLGLFRTIIGLAKEIQAGKPERLLYD